MRNEGSQVNGRPPVACGHPDNTGTPVVAGPPGKAPSAQSYFGAVLDVGVPAEGGGVAGAFVGGSTAGMGWRGLALRMP